MAAEFWTSWYITFDSKYEKHEWSLSSYWRDYLNSSFQWASYRGNTETCLTADVFCKFFVSVCISGNESEANHWLIQSQRSSQSQLMYVCVTLFSSPRVTSDQLGLGKEIGSSAEAREQLNPSPHNTQHKMCYKCIYSNITILPQHKMFSLTLSKWNAVLST